MWAVPRVRAAFRLYQLASVRADHAVCMAGPLGAELLRERPEALVELLRRRVVSAEPGTSPFSRCAKFGEAAALSHSVLRAHFALAREFREYGLEGKLSVTEIALSTTDLAELAEAAWPLVRGDYRALVEPSLDKKEAPHPSTPPSPGLGHGLPSGRFLLRAAAERSQVFVAAFGSGANALTFTSSDGGVGWQPGGLAHAGDLIDRCAAGDDGSGFTFSLTAAGRRVVISHGPTAPPEAAVLTEPGDRVLGLGCGGGAVVAAVLRKTVDRAGSVVLRHCALREPCADLTPPPEIPLGRQLDVARVGRDTVVASTHQGLTRVTTSRDDGRSWTPWTLVFDASAVETAGLEAPTKLLAVGGLLLLHGAPRADGGQYLLLVSDDRGASFHAPRSVTAPPMAGATNRAEARARRVTTQPR